MSSTTVHPHGRGDNRPLPLPRRRPRGSPPRAWGQLGDRRLVVLALRFTPTGVGTITIVSDRLVLLTVHPHGRGDNLYKPTPFARKYGSPPRAWGQCWNGRFNRRRGRFTPTGVGTIVILPRIRPSPSVHPHGRGDNRRRPAPAVHARGSPPRAWGQCGVLQVAVFVKRFTPTGVGTIRSCGSSSGSASVHPHGRGDNKRRIAHPPEDGGSPPRAWGQCLKCTLSALDRRFTPTGVGTIPVLR